MNASIGSTPTELYEQGLTHGHWRRDRAQELVLKSLDRIHEGLNGKSNSLLDKLGAAFRDNTPVQGLYLWGGVGRGKTFLTDLLFESLPEHTKTRWHFHRFMQDIHARLRDLTNTEDTLSVIAKGLAKNTRLLILDEFFVSDIGDAMILGRIMPMKKILMVDTIGPASASRAKLPKSRSVKRSRNLPTGSRSAS